MNFSEKIRAQRIKLNLTQQELADQLGVSLRTITNYETGGKHPRKRELYSSLAKVLQVNINYLLTEEDEFSLQAQEHYGATGANQADALIHQMNALFAGGELSEQDKDAVMQALQQIYWDAKAENKKYAPKKLPLPKEHKES